MKLTSLLNRFDVLVKELEKYCKDPDELSSNNLRENLRLYSADMEQIYYENTFRCAHCNEFRYRKDNAFHCQKCDSDVCKLCADSGKAYK